MFPGCANEETFAEEAKSETLLLPGKQILLPQQFFPGGASFRKNVSSFAGALTHENNGFARSARAFCILVHFFAVFILSMM